MGNRVEHISSRGVFVIMTPIRRAKRRKRAATPPATRARGTTAPSRTASPGGPPLPAGGSTLRSSDARPLLRLTPSGERSNAGGDGGESHCPLPAMPSPLRGAGAVSGAVSDAVNDAVNDAVSDAASGPFVSVRRAAWSELKSRAARSASISTGLAEGSKALAEKNKALQEELEQVRAEARILRAVAAKGRTRAKGGAAGGAAGGSWGTGGGRGGSSGGGAGPAPALPDGKYGLVRAAVLLAVPRAVHREVSGLEWRGPAGASGSAPRRSWGGGRAADLPAPAHEFGDPLVCVGPSGEGKVPTCPMEVARSGRWHTPTLSDLGIVRALALEAMGGDGCAWLTDSSKRQCLAEILAWPQGVKTVRDKISAEISARKRSAKAAFFNRLGHKEVLSGPAPGESVQERRRAVESALAPLLRHPASGNRDGGDAGTASDDLESAGTALPSLDVWRKSTWAEIASTAPGASAVEDPDYSSSSGVAAGVDILFKNSAAKVAFRSLNGHCAADDEESTILAVARADAWMTASFVCMKAEGAQLFSSRGGARNKRFSALYAKYLPRAVENVLAALRSVVEEAHPDELLKPEHFNNSERVATSSFVCPKTKYEYVSMKPCFFKEHVCDWLGNILDGYIGRCLPTNESLSYDPIRAQDVLARVISSESD